MEQNKQNNNLQTAIVKAVLTFISELENSYQINFLFCAEAGSRGYGTHILDSDLDVKGFFIHKKEAYCQVKKIAEHLSETHQFLQLETDDQQKQEKIEIDFNFYDIREFLLRKITPNNIDQINLWIISKNVYLNRFGSDIESLIIQNIAIPFSALRGHIKSFLKIFQNQLKGKQLVVKELINSIVVGCQYLNSSLTNQFPLYNLYSNIEFLMNLKNTSQFSNVPTLQNIQGIQELAKELHEIKRKQRKGTTEYNDKNKQLMSWLNQILETEFTDTKETNQEKQQNGEMTVEVADQIFKKCLELQLN